MSNVNVSYGLQVFDGATSNILTQTRSNTVSFLNYTILFNERIIVPPSTTAMQVTIPVGAKVILIENLGVGVISVQINSNTGTSLAIAGTNGPLLWMPGPSGLTTLYLSNADVSNAGSVNISLAG